MSNSPSYTQEQLDQVLEDFKHLTTMWNTFVLEQTDTSNGHIHAPPALAYIMECLQKVTIPSDSSLLKASDRDPHQMGQAEYILALYASLMFHFGQHCYKNGIIIANMLPCICGELTVQDLLSDIFKEGEGEVHE